MNLKNPILIFSILLALYFINIHKSLAADAEQDSLKSCISIAEAESRLACYDQVSGRQSDLSKQSESLAENQDTEPVLADSERLEENNDINPLRLLAYRSNYLLPVSYNTKVSNEPFNLIENPPKFEHLEFKFQFSLESELYRLAVPTEPVIYFGYTQQSFFQAYNTEYSSPFRDTSYEPELGIKIEKNWQLPLDINLRLIRLAFVHQSNGQSKPLSRSWNRVMGTAIADWGENWTIAIRPWARIPDGDSDDNPDIVDYFGHGELYLQHRLGKNRLNLMLRSNIETDKKTIQLSWSRPTWWNKDIQFYIQYFRGYGESLVDYNHQVNRLGMGFILNDWLFPGSRSE